ncbi:hypothetical protein F5Y04DRAFT_281070 [Hypomontagnella monticulosa]|nr:hypothetical protein F5Y04DRAFT_281070 [Hypomontagnella monticulosa]
MKTSVVLTLIATTVAMVSAVPAPGGNKPPTVDELMRDLVIDPKGKSELLEDNRVVSYDRNRNIIDEKQADPEEAKKYWEDYLKNRKSSRGVTLSPPEEERVAGLARREEVCATIPCQDQLDCRPHLCYGGCWPTENGVPHCYP